MRIRPSGRGAAALLHRHGSPAVLLHRPFPPQLAPAGRSFFGGLPTLPDGEAWPRTSAGVPLHFLCQVDCAEIGWRTRLPEAGLLLFFGRQDGMATGTAGAARDDYRVIYAPDGPAPGATAPPPDDLPAIGGDFPRSPFKEVALDGEQPRRLHPKWPALPLPIETFPDASALAADETDRVNRQFLREYRVRRFLRRLLPGIGALPRTGGDWSDETIWDEYDAALSRARARAFEAATGITPAEPLPGGAQSEAAGRLFDDDAFPQHWILVHFFARAALRRRRGSVAFEHPKPTPEELARRAEADDRLDAEARAWFDRSCAFPPEARPAEDVRREFRSWAADLQRRPVDPAPSLRALEWSRTAATWAVREWAGDRKLAAMLPPAACDAVADLFRLSRIERSGGEEWFRLRFSQMLGHAPASQDAKPVDDPEICLLNLASDHGLGWSFGDAGECSFWIDPGDLAARDFGRVRGTIGGH